MDRLLHVEVGPGRLDPGDRPHAHNLPSQPTRLIGREEEMRQLTTLLSGSSRRLITLSGPGGVGKTRLAVAAAEHVRQHFPGGVWFVDLTSLSDPALVTSSIARAVSGCDGILQDSLVAIAECSRDRMLLVLDNFEHLRQAAPVLDTLVAACPNLTALVTSREMLHLRREQVIDVRPLAVPDPQRSSWTLGDLEAVPAVELFVDRAQAIDSTFCLSAQNAEGVADLTRRLDGLPLALELAAARMRFLDPAALLARMADSLTLLRWETCDVPARHRTMRSNVDWSYALLDAEEQVVFRRLSVFSDGFTLEEMASVAATDELERDGLDLLAALTDKHLVCVLEGGTVPARFTMLTAIREYACERLVESGEAEQVRRRYLALRERTAPAPGRRDRLGHGRVISPREQQVLALLAQGHSNRDIADVLFVAPNTVKTHVASLLTKLNAHNRTQLATIAVEHELLPV